MTEDKQARTENPETGGGQKRSKYFIASVALVCMALYFVLIVVAIWHPYLNERVKFATESGLSLAILIAVVAQVVIYRAQWHVMNAQWRTMEKQTEYAQRAYVCIPSGNMGMVEEIGTRRKVLVFALRLENTGNTPAADVQTISFTDVAKEVPDPALRVTGQIISHGGLIAPKAHTRQWIRAPELSSEQDQRWIAGEVEVFCSGVVTYRSFGKVRTTKFCFLRRVGSDKIESYSKWNDAD
ncbi:MAG TPA: hypothetical protein VKB05_01015 [Pyrinomonadaceae bacterium]|nr:hypothetical protein [Pyrinomonadaceae bacterium]